MMLIITEATVATTNPPKLPANKKASRASSVTSSVASANRFLLSLKRITTKLKTTANAIKMNSTGCSFCYIR